MTQPSDRARSAAADLMRSMPLGGLVGSAEVEEGGNDGHRFVQAFATFERETPGFAAGVEAEHLGPIGRQLLRSLGRNLTPAPPASEGLDADEFSMGPPPDGVPSYWPDEHGVLQPTNDAARAIAGKAADAIARLANPTPEMWAAAWDASEDYFVADDVSKRGLEAALKALVAAALTSAAAKRPD